MAVTFVIISSCRKSITEDLNVVNNEMAVSEMSSAKNIGVLSTNAYIESLFYDATLASNDLFTAVKFSGLSDSQKQQMLQELSFANTKQEAINVLSNYNFNQLDNFINIYELYSSKVEEIVSAYNSNNSFANDNLNEIISNDYEIYMTQYVNSNPQAIEYELQSADGTSSGNGSNNDIRA